jgi:peptide/nickel transport system substrate-binding protein
MKPAPKSEAGRRRACLAMVLALATGVLGLGDSAAGQSEDVDTTPLLRIALAGDENTLSPYMITFRSGKTIDLVPLVYDSLWYSPFEEEPELWLAERSETSEDGRVWTVDIRSGVTWHDGEPMTAEDVAFTYRYFAEHESPLYSHHVNDLPFVEQSEVVDENTVRFTCREPCPTFDIDPGAHLPILPRHIWENVADPATFAELPVGSGPYRLVRHDADQLYVFEANAEYFRGAPLVERIEMPIIPDSAAMFLALRSGAVDSVSRVVPPETIAELEGAGLEIVRMTDYGSVQMNFNNQRPPFDIPALRKALTLAVDTEEITRTLLLDRADPGVASFLDPDSPFADTSLQPEFDPEAAGEALDGLGFVDTDGDGIRQDRDGAPLDVEVLVPAVDAREVRAAELVAGQLADVGVRLRVTPLDPASIRQRTREASETQTGDWQLEVQALAGGHFHFDPDGLPYLFHCPGEMGISISFTGYCNPELDPILEEATTLDVEERKPLLRQAQQVLFEAPPAISLYFPEGTFAYRGEAYSGWVEKVGHGILHKRSFLPGAREAAAVERGDVATEDGGGAGWLLLGAAAIVVVVAALAVARSAKKRAGSATAGSGGAHGPEVD